MRLRDRPSALKGFFCDLVVRNRHLQKEEEHYFLMLCVERCTNFVLFLFMRLYRVREVSDKVKCHINKVDLSVGQETCRHCL